MHDGPIWERSENRRLAQARPIGAMNELGCSRIPFPFAASVTAAELLRTLRLFNWAIDLDMSQMQACVALNRGSAMPSYMRIGQTERANPRVCHRRKVLWPRHWPLSKIQIRRVRLATPLVVFVLGAGPRIELEGRWTSKNWQEWTNLGFFGNSRRLKA